MNKLTVKVALVGISSQFVHSSLAPWCLKAGLKAYARVQDEAQVVEGTVNEAPEKLLERIADSRPDVLGIACYIWNIAYVANLLPLVRDALPDCVLILGGPEGTNVEIHLAYGRTVALWLDEGVAPLTPPRTPSR